MEFHRIRNYSQRRQHPFRSPKSLGRLNSSNRVPFSLLPRSISVEYSASAAALVSRGLQPSRRADVSSFGSRGKVETREASSFRIFKGCSGEMPDQVLGKFEAQPRSRSDPMERTSPRDGSGNWDLAGNFGTKRRDQPYSFNKREGNGEGRWRKYRRGDIDRAENRESRLIYISGISGRARVRIIIKEWRLV